MARPKGSRTGRCQGCNHVERVRIERFLATGASIKGAARKFMIDYHALRRHWRYHVSIETRRHPAAAFPKVIGGPVLSFTVGGFIRLAVARNA